MKYTEYGKIIDMEVPAPDGVGNEAFMPIRDSVLLHESGFMPIELKKGAEALAVHLGGQVHGGKEYLSAVFICSWVDVGIMVHDMLQANDRSNNAQAQKDFILGLNMTDDQKEKFHRDTRQDRN